MLEILDARHVTVNETQRERVLACTDLDTLRLWIRRAATVASADQLFTE